MGDDNGSLRLLTSMGRVYSDCGNNPLFWAVYMGNTKVVELLLRCREIDANMVYEFGHTALDYARHKDHTGVEALLKGEREKLIEDKGETCPS